VAKKRAFRKYDDRKHAWLIMAEFLVIFFCLMFLLFRFVIGVSFVNGQSMVPTLQDKQMVVFVRIVPEYKVDDIVSVKMPSGDYYVKRVVAVGGDTVDIKEGKFYVNGEERSDGFGETLEAENGVSFPYTVREGQVFVLGDNRSVSVDSRKFGAIIKKDVEGKIIFDIG